VLKCVHTSRVKVRAYQPC